MKPNLKHNETANRGNFYGANSAANSYQQNNRSIKQSTKTTSNEIDITTVDSGPYWPSIGASVDGSCSQNRSSVAIGTSGHQKHHHQQQQLQTQLNSSSATIGTYSSSGSRGSACSGASPSHLETTAEQATEITPQLQQQQARFSQRRNTRRRTQNDKFHKGETKTPTTDEFTQESQDLNCSNKHNTNSISSQIATCKFRNELDENPMSSKSFIETRKSTLTKVHNRKYNDDGQEKQAISQTFNQQSSDTNLNTTPPSDPVVLVSKNALNNLSDQIALSLNRMRHIEEQMSIIPELQRRLDYMIISHSDENSVSDKNSSIFSRLDESTMRSATSSSLSRPNTFDQTYYNCPLSEQCSACVSNEYSPESSNETGSSIIHHPLLQRVQNNVTYTRYNISHRNQPLNSTPVKHFRSNSFNLRSPSSCSRGSPINELHYEGKSPVAEIGTAKPLDRIPNQQAATSSKVVDYQDLLNDLISLSYSVNHTAANCKSDLSTNQLRLGDAQQNKQNCQQHTKKNPEDNGNPKATQHDVQQQCGKQQHLLVAQMHPFGTVDTNRVEKISNQNNYSDSDKDFRDFQSRGSNQSMTNLSLNCKTNSGDILNHIDNNQNINSNSKRSTPINCGNFVKSLSTRASDLYKNKQRQAVFGPKSNVSNSVNNFQNSKVSPKGLAYNHSSNSPYHHLSHINLNINSNNNNASSMTSNNSSKTSGYISSSSLSRHHATCSAGSHSLQTSPIKTRMDCGCLSIKDHLRYNSMARENRLNNARSQATLLTAHAPIHSSTRSPISPPMNASNSKQNNHVDSSTMTELTMHDVVTRSELDDLLSAATRQQYELNNTYNSQSLSYSVSSLTRGHEVVTNRIDSMNQDENSIRNDDQLLTEHNLLSSSPHNSTDSYEDARVDDSETEAGDCDVDMALDSSSIDSNKITIGRLNGNDDKKSEHSKSESDDEEKDTNSISAIAEPFSLGSSYQDPSDFEEYFSYGQSIERRIKDFMSQTCQIPNDLKFALIRLHENFRNSNYDCNSEQVLKKSNFDQSSTLSSSHVLDSIRKEWFSVTANKDSTAAKTKLYVDFIESFGKHILNIIVNLKDNAENTAMHYAASYFRFDIIKVLLDTEVCDVNCRNKAGYTPLMLLALVDVVDEEAQNIAKHLFNLGDVNIKSKSTGQTALMLAARHGQLNTCKLLIECGADPSLQDYDGSTALMCGSEIGNKDVVKCLLDHRLTDPSTIDNDGLDALTIAMNNGHRNVAVIIYAANNIQDRQQRANLKENIDTKHHSTKNQRQDRGDKLNRGYLAASMRRNRGAFVCSNISRRADSLLTSRVRNQH